MKKQISILFLFIACIIMQAHAIIPHHHHDNEQELQAHHSSDHHDHDSHDDAEEGFADLNHLFSHFVHTEDSFTYTHVDNTNNTLSKQYVLILAILPNHFSFVDFTIQPVRNKSSLKHQISTHSLSSGLRAPPVFLA